MDKRRWTTKPTKDYLDSLKEEYLRIRGNPALVTELMNRVRNWYFARYKCQDDELKEREPLKPGEKPQYEIFEDDVAWQKARKQSIKFWFANNTKKERGRTRGADIKITLGADAGSNSRKLTNEQVYSKLYYPERIKEHAEAEIERVGATKEQQLAVRNRVIREKLEAETEEIKLEVEKKKQEMEQEKAELAEAMKALQDTNRRRLNFEELARVQKHLPQILGLFFDDLHTKTGWCFHVQGGEPQVGVVNAPIKYTSYSAGCFDGDVTFELWAKKEGLWKDHWKPFATFVHHVFPEAERLRVAIHVDGACVEDKDALGASGRLPGRLCFADEMSPDIERESAETIKEGSGRGVNKHQETEGADKSNTASKARKEGGEKSSTNIPQPEQNVPGTPGQGNKPVGETNNEPTLAGSKTSTKKTAQTKRKGKGKGTEETPATGGTGIEPTTNTDSGSQAPAFPATNPFGAPPILQQWTQVGQLFGNQLWDPIPGQSTNPTNTSLSGSGRLGTGIGGGGSLGETGDERSNGEFGVDISMEDLEQQLGMSEAMFALAGENIPDFSSSGGLSLPPFPPPIAAPDALSTGERFLPLSLAPFPPPTTNPASISSGGIPLPLTTSALINPDFQMHRAADADMLYHVLEGSTVAEAKEPPQVLNTEFGQYGGGAFGGAEGGGGYRGSVHNSGGESSHAMVSGSGNDAVGGAAGGLKDGGARDGERCGGVADGGVVNDPSNQTSTAQGGSGRKRLIDTCEPAQERGKRARTAKKHPEWVDKAREYLLRDLDAPQWVALVEWWHQWEVQCSGLGGVINGTLPGAAARPAIVKKWLAGDCNWDVHDALEAGDVLVFEEKWVKWWNGMQPKARRSPDHRMPHKLEESMIRAMGALRKAGESGFVLVLRALRMWAPREESNERWHLAVQDVVDAIQAVDLRA